MLWRLLTVLMAVALIALASGCGEEEEVTAGVCDVKDESIIPEPDGKPQHVYFYSPT